MGNQIHISASNLQTEIGTLKSIMSKWCAMKKTPPAAAGGGPAVNELEQIGKAYEELHDTMIQLISNTIGFMENTEKSYQHSDQTAAKVIAKK